MVGRVSKRIRAPVLDRCDFAVHITGNWGRLKSFFEKSVDLVSYQVI